MPLWFDILKMTESNIDVEVHTGFKDNDTDSGIMGTMRQVDLPDIQGQSYRPTQEGSREIHLYLGAMRQVLMKDNDGEEPSESELQRMITEITSHEAIHAGHSLTGEYSETGWVKQGDEWYYRSTAGTDTKETWGKEWLAITAETSSKYERSKSLLNYPGLNRYKKQSLHNFILWIEGIVVDTEHDNLAGKDKMIDIHTIASKEEQKHYYRDLTEEQLISMDARITDNIFNSWYTDYPVTLHGAIEKYGSQHKEFLSKLNFRKAPMKERLSNKVKEVLSGKQHNPHARFESKELFNRLNRQQRILYGPLVTAGHVKEEE